MSDADPLAGVAELDLGRQDRRGYAEAVYCAGKTPEQVRLIAAAVAARPDVVTLFTRAAEEHAAAVHAALPDAAWDADARLLAWPPPVPPSTGGLVLVLAAGTSDLPVAKEAWLTARYLGRRAELVVDVGVAGLHRILGRLDLLRSARVVVVAAGMDGALPERGRGARPGAGRRAADVGGLRGVVRRRRRAADHAQQLRPRGQRGQHRQRVRRRPPRRADRRTPGPSVDRAGRAVHRAGRTA